jgi:hypothetical protein
MTACRAAALLCLAAAALGGSCAGDPPPPVAVDPPAAAGALAPELSSASGGVALTWLEAAGAEGRREQRLLFARLDGTTWTAPRQIAAGGAFFANWADRPALAAGPGGELFAHWLRKSGEDTYAYGVELARSRDGGSTWERLGLLHDDDSLTEHGFVSYAPAAAGVHAFWLDGRRMAEEGPMELRTAFVAAAGAPPDFPPASTVLDDRVCECCATDAALTAEGPIVVYRDRSAEEVRDIAVVRAAGQGWTEPRILHPDGWRIHGCPVNGPAVAARGARVAVAWFSVVGGAPEVKVAFSDDAGATFEPPLLIDGEGALGRVDVELDDAGGAYVSWLAAAGEAGEIRLRRVAASGELGAARVIAATSQARRAGVPRMVRDGERLVFAWVEDAEPPRLRAAVVPLG